MARLRAEPMHAGHVLRALVLHFDWFRNRCMPEWWLAEHVSWNYRGRERGRADLVVVTPSRYLTEVEIKTSLADWQADRRKTKWEAESRPHVTRFFYAVPESLVDRMPDWIPDTAGLLAVSHLGRVLEIRAAKRLKAEPLTERQIAKMYEACYFRYWRERLRTLPKLKAAI